MLPLRAQCDAMYNYTFLICFFLCLLHVSDINLIRSLLASHTKLLFFSYRFKWRYQDK